MHSGCSLTQSTYSFIQEAFEGLPCPAWDKTPEETWASGQDTWAIKSSGPGWLCDPGEPGACLSFSSPNCRGNR